MPDDVNKNAAVKAVREAFAAIQRAKNSEVAEEIVRDAESLLAEARVAMKAESYGAAAERADMASKAAETAVTESGTEDWVLKYQELTGMMVIAEEKIKEAKKKGAPTSESEEVLRQAMKALEEKDYETSRAALSHAVAAADAAMKQFDEVKDIVLQAQLAVTDMKNRGMNVSEFDGMINRALIALDYGRFDEALTLAEEILKRGISVTEQAKEAKKGIKDAERAIKDGAAEGLTVTPFRDELDVAKRAFEEKDFDQAMALAKGIEEKLGSRLKMHSKVMEIVRKVRQELMNLRSMNVDTGAFEVPISDVLSLDSEHRYDEALDKAKDINMALDEIQEIADDISKTKASIEENIKQLIKWNIDYGIFNESMAEGDEALKDMRFKTALDTYKKTDEKLGEYVSQVQELKRIQSDLSERYEELKEKGMIAGDLSQELEMIKTDAKEGNISRLEDWRELNRDIGEKYEGYSESRRLLQEINEMMEEANSIQMPTTSYLASISGVEEKIKRGSYDEAINKAHELSNELGERLQRYKSIDEAMKKAEKYVDEAQRYGIDVSDHSAQLNTARADLENFEFDQAAQIVETIGSTLENISESYGKVEDLLRLLRARIRVMDRAGAYTDELKGKMGEVERSRDKGEVEAAGSLAQDLVDEAKSKLEKFNEVKRKRERVEKSLHKASGAGINVTEVEEAVLIASELVSEGRYEDAKERLVKAEEKLSEIRTIQSTCVKAMHNAWKNILEIYQTDVVDIDELTFLRDDAASLMKEGAFREAKKEIAELQKKSLETLENANEFVSKVVPIQSMTDKLEKIGGTVGDDIKDDLSTMKSMLSQGDIEVAREIANDVRLKVESLLRKNEELVDLVGTAQTKISEAKGKGLEVSEAEGLFTELSELWQEGEYEDAKDRAKKCIEVLLRKELSGI